MEGEPSRGLRNGLSHLSLLKEQVLRAQHSSKQSSEKEAHLFLQGTAPRTCMDSSKALKCECKDGDCRSIKTERGRNTAMQQKGKRTSQWPALPELSASAGKLVLIGQEACECRHIGVQLLTA